MRRVVLSLALATTLGPIAVGVAGCGGGSSATTQTADDQAVCESAAGVQQAAKQITALDPKNTTVSQLTAATTSLASSVKDLGATAKGAASDDKAALQSAAAGLTSAVKGFGGQSVSEDVQDVKAAIPPVQQAVKGVAPNCTTSGTATG
jgi:hypothetical protein